MILRLPSIHIHQKWHIDLRQQILKSFEDDRFVETVLGETSESDSWATLNFMKKSPLLRSTTRSHAADIADDILEALPYDERLALWHLVDNNERGAVLVEASVAAWDSLIKDMTESLVCCSVASLHVDEQGLYCGAFTP